MGREHKSLEAVLVRLGAVDADNGNELVGVLSSFVSALRSRPAAEQSRGAEVAGYLTGLLERKCLAPSSRAAALCGAVAAQADQLAAGRPLDLAPVRRALAKMRVTGASAPAPGTP